MSVLPPEPPVRAGGRLLLRPRRRRRHPVRPEPQPARPLRGHPRASDDLDGRRCPRSSTCSGRRSSARSRRRAGPRRSTGCAGSRVASPTPPGVSCSGACTRAWAARSGSSCLPAAFLPPALQQAWEDLGIVVIQGYGSTESGFGTCTSREDHGLGTVGRTQPPIEMRLAPDGEILFRGPSIFRGYCEEPEASAAAFTDDGWYRSGDIGRFDDRRAPRPDGADEGHHRAARTASTSIPRTSRTSCGSPGSGTPSCSRRDRGGSRRWSSSACRPTRARSS